MKTLYIVVTSAISSSVCRQCFANAIIASFLILNSSSICDISVSTQDTHGLIIRPSLSVRSSRFEKVNIQAAAASTEPMETVMTATPTDSVTRTPTPSPTREATATASPTATTVIPTRTPSPTIIPTATSTATAIITATPSDCRALENAKITAYSSSPDETWGDGTITAMGNTVRKGTMAVDPRIIPMGSEIYVPGYGWGIADDTGDGVKGRHIDVWMPSKDEAIKWGVKHLEIRVCQIKSRVNDTK